MNSTYTYGQAGQAWKLDLPALWAKHNLDAAQSALLGAWVIHAPQSHPLWPWYRMTLIHLRPVPGVVGADEFNIYLPGATHEFIIEALDPSHYPVPTDDFPLHTLKPINFGAQMIKTNDAEAIEMIEKQAVLPIVHGMLNPDTDGIRQWAAVFGDNMLKDAGCMTLV